MSDEYLDYDELDDYVDRLFRQSDPPYEDDYLYGDVLSGDLRSDRIDQIIQDAYDEVIRWHNQQIAEGTDPGSGLHGLPPVPWDERLDGAVAMMGMVGEIDTDGSYGSNGDPRPPWEIAGITREEFLQVVHKHKNEIAHAAAEVPTTRPPVDPIYRLAKVVIISLMIYICVALCKLITSYEFVTAG